jgi:hypothetical protein
MRIGSSQYFLHANLLGHQTAFFIKALCRGITGPHIQRHIVAALTAGKIQHMLIDPAANMPPPAFLFHTEIINI